MTLSTTSQSTIVLSTINASYIHTAFGLRYLYANLGVLQSKATILEYTTHLKPVEIAEKILSVNPKIIGFGVYIWNIEHTTKVIQLIKSICPAIKIIIGGPEVSYEYKSLPIFLEADYLIKGAADTAFGQLCQQILDEKIIINKVFQHKEPELDQLNLPYEFYKAEDIKNRVIYVEASRGCPFKCEFCLSALDKTSYPFELDKILEAIDRLYQRGGRNFKFVDRTFNLKISTSQKILEFFLQRIDEDLFVHFEIIPDRLPKELKTLIAKFPRDTLQFEVGVQSFNPQVQALISRKQNNNKTIENMRWLRQHSKAHIHADLIFGLPGEDLYSFEQGFNRLYELKPHDIQVGILKRLKGTPIIRHSNEFNLVFEPHSPYQILSTSLVNFNTTQRIVRFARYWELYANSGRFEETLSLILGANPFQNFLKFSDWLFASVGKTHQIALRKMYDYVYFAHRKCLEIDCNLLINKLMKDYEDAGLKGSPEFYKSLK